MNALVLDRSHRILVSADGSTCDAGCRSFRELRDRLGIPLPGPVGVNPPDFVFLLETDSPEVRDHRWVAMGEAAGALLEDRSCWNLYTKLMLGGYAPPSRSIDVFFFGNTPFMAARLAHLVAKGRKRATSGNPEVHRKLGLTIPSPGLVSIVTDGFGVPVCCIETLRVEWNRFIDVTDEIARGEGEGDLSLEDWREGHWEFFRKEAGGVGVPFDEQSQVFTEWFRVLKVFGSDDQV